MRLLDACSAVAGVAVCKSHLMYDTEVMEASLITLNVKLEAATKKHGQHWTARCVPLDVFSQGNTKEKALASLSEAVQLWFESCIDRDVLSEALAEAGFVKAKPDEVAEDDSLVEVKVQHGSIPKKKSSVAEYITVSVPAYVAAVHLGGVSAPR